MKLFLYINAKKIETVISYFDNYLWNAGIQKKYIISSSSRRNGNSQLLCD